MKNKFYIMCISIKNNILPAFIILFIICLVLFSKQNLFAAKNGLLLFGNSVVPALLPFFIATDLLSHTKVIAFIDKLLSKYMKLLFNVPGIGAYAFIMGIISGYPVGAKIVTKFRQDGICSKTEAERLLAFTNNSGPLFILGTVGISLFGNSTIRIIIIFDSLFSMYYSWFII